MYVLYAEFTAKPGHEDAAHRLITSFAKVVRMEPGNVRFEVYRKSDDPRAYFVFEEYADEDSFRAHIDAEYGAGFNSALSELVVESGSRLTSLTPVSAPA